MTGSGNPVVVGVDFVKFVVAVGDAVEIPAGSFEGGCVGLAVLACGELFGRQRPGDLHIVDHAGIRRVGYVDDGDESVFVVGDDGTILHFFMFTTTFF